MSSLEICGIYKITNNINGKYYIGKSKNIKIRWKQHRSATDSSPLHQAIKKYGKDNFSIEILEKCLPEELNDKEIYWIKQYNGYLNSECYNATLGGDGASHPVKISHEQLLQIIDLLKNTNLTRKQIGDQFQVSEKTISDINLGISRKLLDVEYPIRKNHFAKIIISKEQLEKDFSDCLTMKQIQKKYNISAPTLIRIRKEYNLF